MAEKNPDLKTELALLDALKGFFAQLDELERTGAIDGANDQAQALNNALGHYYAGLLAEIRDKGGDV